MAGFRESALPLKPGISLQVILMRIPCWYHGKACVPPTWIPCRGYPLFIVYGQFENPSKCRKYSLLGTQFVWTSENRNAAVRRKEARQNVECTDLTGPKAYTHTHTAFRVSLGLLQHGTFERPSRSLFVTSHDEVAQANTGLHSLCLWFEAKSEWTGEYR